MPAILLGRLIPMPEQNVLPPLIIECHQRLSAFFSPRVDDLTAAEAVLHAAYAAAQKKPDEPKDGEPMAAWLSQLLRNSLTLHYRATDSERWKRPGFPEEAKKIRKNEDEDIKALAGACLAALLPALKADQADLFRRAEIENRALKDMAHRERTSPADIAVRLHRARAALKKKVLQACGACATHASMDCACHLR